jgi:hypothetical protein
VTDVDEVLAGLGPAQRAELLERLQEEAAGEDPDLSDLEERVRVLEEQERWSPGPRRSGRPGPGPGSRAHRHHWHHWHCDHCGRCMHGDW